MIIPHTNAATRAPPAPAKIWQVSIASRIPNPTANGPEGTSGASNAPQMAPTIVETNRAKPCFLLSATDRSVTSTAVMKAKIGKSNEKYLATATANAPATAALRASWAPANVALDLKRPKSTILCQFRRNIVSMKPIPFAKFPSLSITTDQQHYKDKKNVIAATLTRLTNKADTSGRITKELGDGP